MPAQIRVAQSREGFRAGRDPLCAAAGCFPGGDSPDGGDRGRSVVRRKYLVRRERRHRAGRATSPIASASAPAATSATRPRSARTRSIYPNVTIRERMQNRRARDSAQRHRHRLGWFWLRSRAGGARKKVPQIGIVQIDDDVEIGANTTIDRARFGRTWIQEGVKIDNLVQIAHNVVVGKHTVICAQCGIAGSVRIGDARHPRRPGWRHRLTSRLPTARWSARKAASRKVCAAGCGGGRHRCRWRTRNSRSRGCAASGNSSTG